MNARFQRGVLAAGAAAAAVLLATQTAPDLSAARGDVASAERRLSQSEEEAQPLLESPGGAPDLDALREEVRRASLFLEAPVDPEVAEAEFSEHRARTIATLSARHEIPVRLLEHLFPAEPFEAEGRSPSPEERRVAARRLRVAQAAVETLLLHRIADVDFLVFPKESRPGGLLLVLRYRGAAADHDRAYAALVGRRTEPPYFLPERLSLAADPAGAREGDLVVRLALWVPGVEGREGS